MRGWRAIHHLRRAGQSMRRGWRVDRCWRQFRGDKIVEGGIGRFVARIGIVKYSNVARGRESERAAGVVAAHRNQRMGQVLQIVNRSRENIIDPSKDKPVFAPGQKRSKEVLR